jgi:phosphoribosylanthranilate isomerase
MVKIKFCGMTNLDDCMRAVDLGVDFLGFVFYKRSRRAVTPGRVRRIVDKLAGKAASVGVFVEESDREIGHIAGYCGLDYAQVYRPSAIPDSIRACRVGVSLPDTPEDGLILFDSYTPAVGGAGRRFDLGLLKDCKALGRAFIAGGIDLENVGEALRMQPFGIDLVSSIEASPGRKDRVKMEKFMEKVRAFRI